MFQAGIGIASDGGQRGGAVLRHWWKPWPGERSVGLNLAVLHRDLAVGGPGDLVAVGDDHEGELA
jgi:hypothetical protein